MADIYIKTDKQNRVTAVSSSVFLRNEDGWVKIAEGHGNEYVHVSSKFFGKELYTESRVPQYKYEDGIVIERTPEEMEADIPKPVPLPPTNAELLQIIENTYDAMFDGVKYVADREHPIPLKLPVPVRRNLIYSYNDRLYVCLKDGLARECEFDGYFVPDA